MPPSDVQVLSRLHTRKRQSPRTPLERLPFTDQQYYSTLSATSQGTHMTVESLHRAWALVPFADLIKLCPPDIQPAAGVPWSQPARFPTWIFYPDGRSRCIASPEELALQPSGYVCYPHVPFPDTRPPSDPLAGMGVTWYGPFASHLCGYPSLDGFHPDDLVYATEPMTYGKLYGAWRRSEGEYFALEGLFDDADLLKQEKVRPVNPRGQRFPHAETERVFGDPGKLVAYARRYKDGDISGWVAETLLEQESTPLAGRTRRGAPPAAWKSWTREETLARFVKAADDLFEASRSPRARRARLSWERLCPHMNPSMHRNTIREVKNHHRITLEDIEAELHK